LVKALVTAGGKGTRLRPITNTHNKHLIPIANKPMIGYALEALAEAGVREVGVVVNPDTSSELQRALGGGEAWGVKISYVLQEAPLGLAHAVRVARDFLGDEPFVFYLGDNVIVGGVGRFIEEFKSSGDACRLVLARVRDPERFGVPELRDGRLVGVEEKPANPKSDFAVTGIYLYDHHIFEAVNAIQPSARGELEISDAHQYLIDHGYRVGYSEITGWWKDTGKPEDLLEANRLVLDKIREQPDVFRPGQVDAKSDIAGKVILEPGAAIIGSQIRGPVIIGARTLVENSYVGPFTAIGPDCVIRDSEVEYSIVLERCRIIDADIRIERSLLGREAEIIRCKTKPMTQKFIVGDQSRIELT
jgi:glucose-1-phosphate thymidylyltransferase